MPQLTSRQAVALTTEMAHALRKLSAEVTWVDDTKQTRAKSLLLWDLGQFACAAAELARSGLWSPAAALSRPIQERWEYLLAAHHSEDFAHTYMDSSDPEVIDPDKPPRMRPGAARGFVKRWFTNSENEPFASEALEDLIRASDWAAMDVHPNAVAPIDALQIQDNPEGSAANRRATMIGDSVFGAMGAALAVIEESAVNLAENVWSQFTDSVQDYARERDLEADDND